MSSDETILRSAAARYAGKDWRAVSEPMTAEPRTAAGRDLLANKWLTNPYGEAHDAMRAAVLAIEAEAARLEATGLAILTGVATTRGEPEGFTTQSQPDWLRQHDARVRRETPLDVERLARALHAASPETHFRRKCRERHDLRAEIIAAEYARLAAEGPRE